MESKQKCFLGFVGLVLGFFLFAPAEKRKDLVAFVTAFKIQTNVSLTA